MFSRTLSFVAKKSFQRLLPGGQLRLVASLSPESCWESMTESTKNLALSITNDGPIHKRVALSRAITLMESKKAQKKQQADYLLTYLLSKRPRTQEPTLRMGFAGPPGQFPIALAVSL